MTVMRIILLISFVFLFNGFSFSQSQTNIWYFGKHAGLDFNSGKPVPLTDGQINSFEGCATMSDSLGNLLFYTDGMKIWNAEHEIMPNGEEILGDTSSTESAIIIPQPGSLSKFYVITVLYYIFHKSLYQGGKTILFHIETIFLK